MTLEHEIESYLVGRVRDAGGICAKFIPDNRRGMPDRIAIFPHGVLVWVETKKPKGGSLSAVQVHRHRELRALGQSVAVCWTREDVDRLMAVYARE